MDINELTLGQIREIASVAPKLTQATNITGPWQVGKCYHIRTVTHYWTGRLTTVTEQELVFKDAAWIGDTGRFSNMFKDGPVEVEPVEGYVIIGRGAIVDAQEWSIALPDEQK